MFLQIVTNAPGAIPVPSAPTDGRPLWLRAHNQFGYQVGQGFRDDVDEAEFILRAVGTGTLVLGPPFIYGYDILTAEWIAMGTGTAATKGQLNGGVNLDETSADKIVHAERVRGFREFERFAASVAVVSGVLTDLDIYLKAKGHRP